MIKMSVNGKPASLDADPEMPLLWALREQLQLTGTKFGCGMALIAVGDGVIGIEGIVKALKKAKIDVSTTLEIAGPEAVKTSAKRLKAWAK